MKSIEDTVSEIKQMIVSEQDLLKGGTEHLALISCGRLDALRDLLEWILE